MAFSLDVIRRLFLIVSTLTLVTGLVCVWGVAHPVAKSLAFVIAAASLLGFFEFWKRDLSLLGTYATILSGLFISQFTFVIVAVLDIPEAHDNTDYFWTVYLLLPLVALLIILLILTHRATIASGDEYSELVDDKSGQGSSATKSDYGASKKGIFRSHWQYQDRNVNVNDAHEFLPKPKNPNDTTNINEKDDNVPENDWWCC